MEFDEMEFFEFVRKFKGDFSNLLPDNIPVYIFNENYYLLPNKKETLSQIKKSMENNINLLLENPTYVFSNGNVI